jgi:chromosome segregation ATPase
MSKSRNTQRRVKGQHADPIGDIDDPLIDVAPPSSNSGLMFLQQLRRGGAADGGGVDTSTLPLPVGLSDDEIKQIRNEARAQALKLLQEKGDAGVQAFLQQQIQATKKKESDIAVAKKRGEAAAREKDQLTSDLHRVTTAKSNAEMQCKAMQADIKKQDEECAKATKQLEANRDEMRTNIEQDIGELEKNMRNTEEQDAPALVEVEALKTECAQLKKDFDEAFKEYENNWASKEKETSTIVKELQDVLQRTELLDAKLALAKREAQSFSDGIAVFKEHVKTYEDRFAAFEEVSVRSEEVERVTEMQRTKLQDRLNTAEKEKQQAHEIRLELEKEKTHLRSQLATLKKKQLQLEKTKSAAETKCRTLQQQR